MGRQFRPLQSGSVRPTVPSRITTREKTEEPMSLTFYYAPMSSATRIHWALEELGVPYEKVKVDLAAGDQRKPEFLALNPNGKVPLLVEDGVPIYESLAILIHLGEKYGVEKGLFPAAGPDRAVALRWMTWAGVTLTDAISRIIRNSDRYPAEQRNEAAREQAKKDLVELWGIVDKELAGKEYLVGGKFSFADLAVAGYVMVTGRFGADISGLKNVAAWSARSAMQRPAMGRVMAEYMGGAK
jgi:glutathione S-transferase